MLATILIPTFDHCDTLRYSVASVQAQTIQDFEILIVGDGVPPETRRLVAELARDEPRLHFFAFPKGERNGESRRHQVLEWARGKYVCYLCDDDLWLPSHLEDLTGLLERCDLASTAQLRIDPGGQGALTGFDLANPADRALLLGGTSGFGLASGGHTLDAYRRLPQGWRTTPQGIATDLYMWQQFLREPWCRAASSSRPTVLRFPAALWNDFKDARLEALSAWLRRATEKRGEAEIAWAAFEAIWGASAHPLGSPRSMRLNLESDYPEYELGTAITAADRKYFSWGWSFPESWGIWSDGCEARMTFSAAKLGRVVVEVCFRTIEACKIDVVANGLAVGSWEIEGAGEHRRSLEIGVDRSLDLRFQIPSARPVNELAETTDHRRLGIGLVWLVIRSANLV
jgi:glycosyltransferase involved in cell wall biosynthesis